MSTTLTASDITTFNGRMFVAVDALPKVAHLVMDVPVHNKIRSGYVVARRTLEAAESEIRLKGAELLHA